MKKNTMIWIVAAVVLLAAAAIGVVVYNNSQTKTVDTINTSTNTTTNTNTETTETTVPGTVNIQNFSFTPSTITINKGETVTWKNNDSTPHRIVADDNSFQLSTMNNGGSSQHTFDTTGTFNYHCSIHPDMKGAIIVK